MYKIILASHSGFRYIVLLLLFTVFVKSLMSLLGKKPFSKLDNNLNLWLMISFHIQFLVGIFLYFISPLVKFGSAAMGNDIIRYWTVEHMIMMLVAVVLMTINRLGLKHITNDQKKHKRVLIYTSLVLLFILTALILSGRGIF